MRNPFGDDRSGRRTRRVRPLRGALTAAIALAGLLQACSPQPEPASPTPGAGGGAVDRPASGSAPAMAVPTPASYLGFEVGADRTLADWGEVTGYMEALGQTSPRVKVDTVGTTTLGRPFVMLTITSEENMARLSRLRAINNRLADPRTITSDQERRVLLEEGRTVVLLTASIHSTEVGASQVPLRIAHRLATSEREAERRIREETVVLLVPSLNPDGVDLVVDWYERSLGTEWEGAGPPFLYHHYVGHDNNRDWYFFTQKETQLAIEGAHNAWRPHIVHDIHQQGSSGSRFFVPPWIDPVEPNVDPLLINGANDLGTHMAWKMSAEGMKGVVVNATYDAWTPARAYQHYHGGVRVLSETASANMASPITVPFEDLRQGRNFHAQNPSWNFMEPWPGGRWTLGDIVDYMEAGAFALLDHSAENRRAWLRSFLSIGERAVAKWDRWPDAWLIPPDAACSGQGPDACMLGETAVQELLRVLTFADVEVRRAQRPFTAGARQYPAGTYVVDMRQPYASFAQTMLERQAYPDLRQYPGGPPRPPYDVTAHTLPLLLGVQAVPAPTLDVRQLELSPPIPVPVPARLAPGLTRGTADRIPRIGLYQSWNPSMDEGWTRWILDQYDIPYTTLHDDDIRRGLADFDVVLIPEQSPRSILEGRESGPTEIQGGLGDAGADALRAWVERGGRLVTLEQASELAIQLFDLPVLNTVENMESSEFYIPGSILELDLSEHWLTRGMGESTAAWFERGSMALVAEGAGNVRIVARYGSGDPLLSGWALGQSQLAGAGAVAVAGAGRGEVVLFGFRPQYRAQPVATFPLLFNALRGR